MLPLFSLFDNSFEWSIIHFPVVLKGRIGRY